MIDTREGFETYLRDFNSGDFHAFVPRYYAEDAIFEKTGFTIHGAKNLADHFTDVLSSVVKEAITLINYVKQGDLVAVELRIELVAVKDGFYIKNRKKGEREIFYDAGFYTIRGDKIAHARVYRRFADAGTMDLLAMYGGK